MKSPVLRWERSFTSQLFKLAIPIALQSVVTTFMQIIDNVMIGSLGEVTLAAVTQANRVSFLFQVALFGVVSGTSIFVAQYWGSKDVAGVRKTLGIAAVAGLIVAAVLGLPSILIPQHIMKLLIRNEEGMRLGAQYLGIMGFVYFIQSQSLVQAAVLKSTEQVKLPMVASLVAISTNILFNWLLIFDHGSFGGYGVRGGAFATMIGALVELAFLVIFSRKYHFVNAAKLKEMLPESMQAVKRFGRIALPVLINESLWAGGTVVYSAVYGRIGDGVTAAAAAGVLSNVEQIANIAIRALCSACGVMVGMALGSGELDRAKLYAKRFMIATPAIAQLFCLIVILPLSGAIISIFPVDVVTAEVARKLIYIYVMFTWANAINCTIIVSLLRTGGDVRAAAMIDVIPLWFIGVPVVAIAGLVLKWEMQFVYLMTYVEQVSKVAICVWRYRQNKWVRNIVKEGV